SVMEKHPPPTTPTASMLEEVEVGNSLASAAVTGARADSALSVINN
ncbi:uncharacterized, partial [Tachysurus ichikawai]